MKAYAAFSKIEKERLESSSGGIFSLLAKQVLKSCGVVYGVALDETCRKAEFIRVESIDELYRLRGSKYFQAAIGKTFQHVKADLEEGRDVLFSGTACQINGLRKFLGKDYDRLICVDIICHGVPSPKLWDEYVSYMEKMKHTRIQSVNFRSKKNGWTGFGMSEKYSGTEIFIPRNEDPFMQMFLKNYSLRPSCYNCVTKKSKLSDLTIADFWGIDLIAPEMNDEKGTSLVIVRSEIGTELFKNVSDEIVLKEVSYEDGVRFNHVDTGSVSKPERRDHFYKEFNELSFKELTKKYTTPGWRLFASRVKKSIKKIIR